MDLKFVQSLTTEKSRFDWGFLNVGIPKQDLNLAQLSPSLFL